jgi:hypothetical protein
VKLNRLARLGRVALQKKGESKNEGKSAEVAENKCRKDVSLASCADVVENTLVKVFIGICL